MLETPKEVLGEGYPLPTEQARKETAPIWERAFEIHATAHIGDNRFHEGSMLPVRGDEYHNGTPYCDCYMRAWLEFHDPVKIAEAQALVREKERLRELEEERQKFAIEYFERVV
jgi:hypothetical protein